MIYTNQQFVRWDDIDAFGHVNNAKYLTYIQEARFLWSPFMEMVVAKAEVDYLVPLYVGGRFYDITLWVEHIGNSSFTKVKTVQVAVSMETKKSRPLTDPEREFLKQHLKA